MIITPVDEVKGEVKAPPSKSYTHRAYFLSLLADEPSRVINPLSSDDTDASLDAIKKFGASVEGELIVPPQEIKGVEIDARESGTTARLSLGIAALSAERSVIDGRSRLRERPFGPLVNALKSLGAEVSGERLPIRIRGGVKGNRVTVDASLSSQFVSSLLLLGSRVGLEIEVINPVSRPYIEMTLRTMKAFGVDFEREGYRFIIAPGVKGASFEVPGDYSSASFFLAAGVLYGKVRVLGLDPEDVQADRAIISVLEEFGAEVKLGGNYVEAERDELKAVKIDCSDFPDLFPIIAVLAAYSDGKSVIRARQLRLKESDRVRAMAVNLSGMGIKVRELPDGLEITGGRPRGARIEGFNDHRIVMAMSIAALGAEGESEILDTESVSKSYPSFFNDLRGLLG